MCVLALVCKGVRGYAQGYVLWAGMHRCAQVCTSVHWCAQVCVKVCGCLRVCVGLRSCAWGCTDLHGYVWDEFSQYLLET